MSDFLPVEKHHRGQKVFYPTTSGSYVSRRPTRPPDAYIPMYTYIYEHINTCL